MSKKSNEKIKYKVINWSDYNRSLINRGSINFWLSDDVIENWTSNKQSREKGRPEIYSDETILCILMIREVYKFPLRMLQGFLNSLFASLNLNLPVPSYSQISRRSSKLDKKLKKLFRKGAKDIVFDSSGLKVYGEGEWKVKLYGKNKRRTWRKIHIGMNPYTGEIHFCEMTKNSKSDSKVACDFLSEIKDQVNKVWGDGHYDAKHFRKKVHGLKGEVIVPPPKNATYKGSQEEWERKRDLDIAAIHNLGGDKVARKLWKKLTGYYKRSLVEATFSRIKRVIGSNLKARKFENQKVECQVKCLVMNKMLRLGKCISKPIFKIAA